jgi:uncharacterized protein (TIGR02217 family)
MAQYLIPGFGWFDDDNSGWDLLLPTFGWIGTKPSSPTLTEAASASDTYTETLTWTASESEAATAADAVVVGVFWSKAITEAASATDAYTTTLTWTASRTEAASATDAETETLTWTASRTEAASATDAPSSSTGSATYNVVIAGAATALDAVSTPPQWFPRIRESGSAGDAVSEAYTAPSGTTYDAYKLTGIAVVQAPAFAAFKVAGIYVVTGVAPPEPPVLPWFEPLFPPDLSFPAVGGCGWNTQVVDTASGEEYRTATWRCSLGRWVVSKKLRTPDNMAQMRALFAWAQGQQNIFRFKDWLDFTVSPEEGVLVSLNGGFLCLGKRYTLTDVFGTTLTVDRPIYKPVPNTVVFSPAGPTVSLTTGLVFGGTLGVTTWSGEFHVPARFGSDVSEIIMRLPTGQGWDHITIEEVRFDPIDRPGHPTP